MPTTFDALPSPSSLRAAAMAAVSKGDPLVVMVTLKGCVYCDVVRNNYLAPMLQNGEIHAIQLDMLDRRTPLQDFQGQTSTPSDQVRSWKTRVAPTLLFLNAEGQEVAERLEGMNVPDFYGAYLEQRLIIGRRKIRP